MRAVVDPNVLISALLSPRGSPAQVLQEWLDGAFELIVSPLLLAELERALGYPKIRDRITADEAEQLLDLLGAGAQMRKDPSDPPAARSPDPGDDYLLALAAATQAAIVSGDRHLLDLDGDLPVYAPAAFLALLDAGDG